MENNFAMSILFDPEGFWPQSFHAEARKHIEENGTKEQKDYLGKETVTKERAKNRLSDITVSNFSNKRMGAML